MFFRNLYLLRLPQPWNLALDSFEAQLARRPFQRCGGSEPTSCGWIAPQPDGALAHAVGGQWLVALRVEQRLLPASVIRDEAQDRAATLAETQGYPVGRKQLRELRDRVAEELLPRAFTRRRTTYAWIDPQAGWLCIDAASPAKADELVTHLRGSLDDLPVTKLHTKVSPVSAMADWLAGGEAPGGFTVDRDCELKAESEEKSAVRYVRHPLEGEEIRAHLAGGKQPTRLALTWNDRVSFVLTAEAQVKRVEFIGIAEDAREAASERVEEQFDADFALMTAELARFLPELVTALGGEKEAN